MNTLQRLAVAETASESLTLKARRVHEVAEWCVNPLAYIWLCGGVSLRGAYHTLSDFCTRYGAALDQLMTQMVQRMQAAGLAEFEAHVQDGMRARASAASFHRKATLSKSLEKAQAQVQVLEQARAAETSDLSAREQATQERLPSSQTGDKRSRIEEATMGRASAGQSEVAFSSG